MPSLVDTSVKFVASWMPGAPTVSNVVGQFFSVMDIMVNGADSRACTVTVSSNVAKVTFSGGAHMAIEDAVVLIAGTGEVDLDGEQKISSVEATPVDALVFNTNTSDGVYSGTVKLAPMGWEKVFSGTNKAVYRSLDVFNERMFLRVSQTTYQRVEVRAYRNMSTVDTGTDPMPSFSAFSESMCNWWLNNNNNNSNPTTWAIVTDGTRMYVFNDFSSSGPNYYGGYVHMFGPMKSRPEIVDPNNTVLTATIQTSQPTSSGITCGGVSSTKGESFTSRSYTGIGGYVTQYLALGGTGVTAWTANVNTWGTTYPDPITGAMITSEVYAIGSSALSTGGVRGVIPGVRICCQGGMGGFSSGDKVELVGRRHLSLRGASGPTTTAITTSPTWIDIEGPW